MAVARIIAHIAPDVIVLQGIDYDHDHTALKALQNRIREAGHPMPYVLSAPPNSGVQFGADIDQDGRLGEPEDAQSYGRFAGQGGLGVLSRMKMSLLVDHSRALWRDFEKNTIPGGYYDPETLEELRLSSRVHWEVEVSPPDWPALRLMAWAATAPVFDGPEDRNGRRNRDELWFWNERIADLPEKGAFVLIGKSNLDPQDGAGDHNSMRAILAHPRLQDPEPASRGAAEAADADHVGPPALDTVDWPDDRPGNLRVSYILPWDAARVIDAGVLWPSVDEAQDLELRAAIEAAGPHRLVWVDLAP